MKKLLLRDTHNRFTLVKKALLWHLNYYLKGKPSPLSCSVYLTNMCNLRCEVCNIWRIEDKKVLPWEIYEDLVDNLRDMGCYYLSFSGGEPLLVEDIVKRASYAKERIPYVHIVTNGFLLERHMTEQLGKTGLDEVSISIDGTKKSHDTIRGVEGAFDKALSAIDNLRRYSPKIRVSVNTIISPKNVSELYDVVRLVEELRLYHKFQPVNDHPVFEKQKTTSQKQEFTEKDVRELKVFIEFLKTKKNILNSSYFLSCIPDYFLKNVNHGLFSDRCLLGYHHCEVKEDGALYPCLTSMNWREGFDMRDGFKQTYSSRRYEQKLKELRDCTLCSKNMYICYFEPRITFPITNFIKYTLFSYA